MQGPSRVTRKKLTALYAENTDEQIGRMFGVSGRSIGDWRRHHGIPRKPRHTYNRYTLDRDFFAVIDTPRDQASHRNYPREERRQRVLAHFGVWRQRRRAALDV